MEIKNRLFLSVLHTVLHLEKFNCNSEVAEMCQTSEKTLIAIKEWKNDKGFYSLAQRCELQFNNLGTFLANLGCP